jgi:hypothetical protein
VKCDAWSSEGHSTKSMQVMYHEPSRETNPSTSEQIEIEVYNTI